MDWKTEFDTNCCQQLHLKPVPQPIGNLTKQGMKKQGHWQQFRSSSVIQAKNYSRKR
jgi:hypothetical protein